MVKKISFFLLVSFAVLASSAVHIGLTYLLPYPFSKLNLLFVLIIFFMVWFESGSVVWIAFFSHLFIELFSLTPFGIILFSATMATLFSYWLYEKVITNRSVLAATVLCFLALFMYRAIYFLLLAFVSLVSLEPMRDPGFLLITVSWEMLFTCLAFVLLYLVWYPVMKRLGSRAATKKHLYGRYS